MRVLALMSGGLDSSMAAAYLLDQGHEVVGLTYRMLPRRTVGGADDDAAEAAQHVASALGIEHHVLDLSHQFEELVLAPLASAYASGTTPNPCVLCNPRVKLAEGLRYAERTHCTRVATGHYARISRSEGGARLLRGADRGKDQSYFLYRVPSDTLGCIEFPLGEKTKACVRADARRLGLPVSDRRESQDACFLALGTIADLVGLRMPGASDPGDITDEAGRVLGQHLGIAHFTVGQRRGLGIGGGPPLYVLRIDPDTQRIVVGGRDRLAATRLLLRDCLWHADDLGASLMVMPRYQAGPLRCEVQRRGNEATVLLEQPYYGGAPGQSAVVYEGDRVVGGGYIAAAIHPGE